MVAPSCRRIGLGQGGPVEIRGAAFANMSRQIAGGIRGTVTISTAPAMGRGICQADLVRGLARAICAGGPAMGVGVAGRAGLG